MIAESSMNDNSNMSALLAVPETVYDPAWYPDSGATNHIAPDSANLLNSSVYSGDQRIKLANGDPAQIQNIGNSYFLSPTTSKPLFLQNLLHVHAISKNLLSVSQFAQDNKVFFEFHSDYCYVKSQASNKVLLAGKLRNGLNAFNTIDLTKTPLAKSQFRTSSNTS